MKQKGATTQYSKRLSMRQGSGVVEFLIWAPVLILICFAAYDLNKRVEESQSLEVAIRNVTSLGNPTPINSLGNQPEAQNFSTLQSVDYLKSRSGIRDQKELAQIVVAPSPEAFGLNSNLDIITSVEGDLLSQNSQISPQGNSTGFNSATAIIGSAASLSSEIIEKIQGVGSGLGFLSDNKIRQQTVQLSISGRSNAIQGSMAQTMALVNGYGNGSDVSHNEILGIERRFSGRLFLRPEHGYHDSAFNNSGLYGMGLGLSKPNWGNGSDGRPKSKFLQRRCMSRFYSANNCDTKINYAVGYFGYPQDAFPVYVKGFAEAMYTLSLAIKLIGGVPAIGQAAVAAEIAVKEGIDQIAESIGEEVFNTVIETVKDKVTSPATDLVEQQLAEFQNIFEAPLEGITSPLDPSKMLGGQEDAP